MPSLSNIVRRFTDDNILYWEKDGDDPFGKPLFKAPVPLKVRWEDKIVEVVTFDGRTVLAKAYILSADELKVGSIIWKGTIASWGASAYYPLMPTVNQGGFEVIVSNITPGIKQLPGKVYESYL